MSVEQALLVGCSNISEVKWQDKHHLLAVEWDSVFEVTDEQLEQTAMSMDDISHIGVFPQDIIISVGKAKTALVYNDKNIIRIKDYKMIEENDKIAIGLSGGKDSISLLLALSDLC